MLLLVFVVSACNSQSSIESQQVQTVQYTEHFTSEKGNLLNTTLADEQTTTVDGLLNSTGTDLTDEEIADLLYMRVSSPQKLYHL